jgi:hypothetical protein
MPLMEIDPHYPTVSAAERAELVHAGEELSREGQEKSS